MGADNAAGVFSPVNSIMNSIKAKEKGKTEREQNEQNYNLEMADKQAAIEKDQAEQARIQKIKDDEEALVRRNQLTAAVKQRLSGRSSSASRLTDA